MRPLLFFLVLATFTFTACEEEVTPVGVDLKVYLTSPLAATPETFLPLEFSDLLRPLKCEDKLAYLDVELTIVRLDHDPVVSETISLPLSWINEWRKSSDTYTYANHLDNYTGSAANIPYPAIFTLEPGNANNGLGTAEGEVLYCCGAAMFKQANSATEIPLEALPQYLSELSCEKELKDRYAISYFLTSTTTLPSTPLPVLSPVPASAPLPLPDHEATIIAALNQTGDSELDPETRFTLIADHLKLFTPDAHVKIYGDNGTITDNQTIGDYLEVLSVYRTIDTIYVDKALMRDSLCWELRVREIHQ